MYGSSQPQSALIPTVVHAEHIELAQSFNLSRCSQTAGCAGQPGRSPPDLQACCVSRRGGSWRVRVEACSWTRRRYAVRQAEKRRWRSDFARSRRSLFRSRPRESSTSPPVPHHLCSLPKELSDGTCAPVERAQSADCFPSGSRRRRPRPVESGRNRSL